MKLIPLNTKRKTNPNSPSFANVDDEDYDYLMQWLWYAKYNRSGKTWYAIRGIKNELNNNMKHVYMHKVIMNCPKDIYVDHVNKDGLCNLKNNLRLATRSQNNSNRKSWGKYSKYKGVSFVPPCKKQRTVTPKWICSIQVNKKKITIGRYDGTPENEILAAKDYDRYAKIHHGEFATLNFPNE